MGQRSRDLETLEGCEDGALRVALLCFGADTMQQEFFKTIAGFAYNIPVVGPYLARGLQVAGDKAGANERAHKDLPV